MAIFTVAPFAGPALGPTAAGFIGENISWRWLFWVLTAFVSSPYLSLRYRRSDFLLGGGLRGSNNFHNS